MNLIFYDKISNDWYLINFYSRLETVNGCSNLFQPLRFNTNNILWLISHFKYISRHHPTDVLAGLLIGILTHIVLNFRVLSFNNQTKISNESIPLMDTNRSESTENNR